MGVAHVFTKDHGLEKQRIAEFRRKEANLLTLERTRWERMYGVAVRQELQTADGLK